jgi:cytochrome b subunit of formate dehydrogenase
MKPAETIERFNRNLRIQHFILMISMIMLSLTGLALKFHDTWLGRLLMAIEGGFGMRGIIHRTFALILIGLGVYHFYYILFRKEGHEEFLRIVPRGKDVRDFVQYLRFSILGKGEPPKAGKYDFRQKFQYWGVVAGFWVMVITGFVLWFESAAMAVLPKWFIDVTLVFHGYEGLLIFLVLFLYHLYNVHLNPDHFPMSRVWLDGKISLEQLKKEHPLEYEELFSGAPSSEEEREGGHRAQ